MLKYSCNGTNSLRKGVALSTQCTLVYTGADPVGDE